MYSIVLSNSRSKVCVKYAGPMELWNDALVATCEGQSRRRLSHPRLSANTAMLRTACFLCVIGHRELLYCPMLSPDHCCAVGLVDGHASAFRNTGRPKYNSEPLQS